MTDQPSTSREVASVVGRLAAGLYRGYADDRSAAVARLAGLRRAQARPPGADPDVWWLFEQIPDHLRGRDDQLSRPEIAVFAGMGMFALHQQSKRHRSMHHVGVGLGAAVRRLSRTGDLDEAVVRRFQALGTSQDMSSALPHLRGLIRQLRSDEVPVDHGRLAGDLFLLQVASARDGVRQRWARDLYTPTTTDETASDNTLESDA